MNRCHSASERPSINLWSFKATVTLCNFTRFPQHCNPRTCEQAMICPSTRHPGCKKHCRGCINLLLLALFSLAFLCSHWTSRKHTAPVCSFALTGSEAQEDKSVTCAHPIAHISKAGTYNAQCNFFFCDASCTRREPEENEGFIHIHPCPNTFACIRFISCLYSKRMQSRFTAGYFRRPDGKPRNWPQKLAVISTKL